MDFRKFSILLNLVDNLKIAAFNPNTQKLLKEFYSK